MGKEHRKYKLNMHYLVPDNGYRTQRIQTEHTLPSPRQWGRNTDNTNRKRTTQSQTMQTERVTTY